MKWLNRNSRKFLERGYLEDGETPEQRLQDISETAAKILKDKKFADKFYDYLSKGYYSLSSPVWSNFGKERGYPISCVVGDTIVETPKGGKSARDVVVGDEVLTHKRDFKRVTDVIITRDKNNIYSLLPTNRKNPVFLTGDHPVLTHLGWVKTENLDPSIHTVATTRSSCDEQTAIKRDDGLYYAQIAELKRTERQEDVYDFTVKDDHSFSGNGVVLHNCFNSHISDSIESILYKLSEVGMMTKMGGGTSGYFGEVRPRGSKISTGGESTGSVHFMEMFDKMMNVISQGNVRRGSFAAYLPIDHGDIKEFLKIRSEGHPIQDLSIGVCVSDDWMQSMVDGDRVKRSIWAKVIRKRFESGYPYIFFTDNVNKAAPKVYKDKKKKINSSNLCVAGDQRAPSNFGMLTAKELYEKKESLTLFDGEKQVEASKMELIEKNVQTWKIELENGITHVVTDYHKILTPDGNVMCKDLQIGQKVAIQNKKGIFGKKHMPEEAFSIGLNEKQNRVPQWIWESDEETIRQYIKGLKSIGRSICGKKSFLKEIQIILSNLGITSYINPTLKTVIEDKGSPEYYKIKSIVKHKVQDVFCCKVNSSEHLWVCNGVITSNCSEIMLTSTYDESFVCDLSSMNLTYYKEWKETDAVETLLRFLDAVMTEFINKTEGIPFMEHPRNFAVRQRAIGVGVLGWHTLLQNEMIPFESMEAQFLNKEIFSLMKDRLDEENKRLASEFGAPKLLKGYGLRNVTTMAVAPTTSSSFILGQVSPSIEPLQSNYFVKELAKGKFTFKNPALRKILKEKEKNTDEVWMSILEKGGSVQHLDFLSDKEKDIFKTFGELSQKEIIIQAAQRQKFIDQGQSLNLMIDGSVPAKDVNKLMIFAWEQGIKTLYYQRGTNPAQQLSRNILTCPSCEG